ncbi:MAG: 16S rRNA (cytidine(1402)-2'-O)-methyltransferase [Hyphomicrobiaceae bacterium]|nr:16S rRNA (cytidine(1402)-2'-O)-methyltransferase [Hyphomicrobiaceae bacterium]
MPVDKESGSAGAPPATATPESESAAEGDLPRPGADAALLAEFGRQLAGRLTSGLYLVATPIGNLGDITLRALTVLARADVIYCEDTRRSHTLLQHFGLRRPLRQYHEHNAAQQRPFILGALEEGKSVALISDAGTPLISDPGFKLVRDVVAAGHNVVSVPGASAVLTALTSAGLPTDTFMFCGFLPAKSAARRARLEEFKRLDTTLVFYEAPSRVAEMLRDLAEVLGDRDAAIARELTKLHEEMMRAPLRELAQSFTQREARGEFVVVVSPPVARDTSDASIEEALREALIDMRLKDAARKVADALGVPRSRVYDIGLRLKGEQDGTR